MQIRVLGCSGGELPGRRVSSFLMNRNFLLDAGSATAVLPMEQQLGIEHVLVTHAHLDHTVGAAFLADNLSTLQVQTQVTLGSIEPVVHDLRSHCFNNRLWPDFSTLSGTGNGQGVFRFHTLMEGVETRVGDLWVTAVPVDHGVPCTGYLLHDGQSGVAYSGDTGPTERLWKAIRGVKQIRAAIVECAFPNRLRELARASGHLTPDLLGREVAKMDQGLPIWVFHVKPQFFDETVEELYALKIPRLELLEQDKIYTL